MEIVHVPLWTYLLLVLGFIPFAFVYMCIARRMKCRLPIARGVSAKRSLAALGMLVFGLPLFFGLIGLVVEPGAAVVIVVAVSLAGFGGSFWLNHSNAVIGRWVDEYTVKVKNVHPDFAAAVTEALERETRSRMTVGTASNPGVIPTVAAAWYPDPSGQFDQRYWDGAAWTTQVHGLRAAGSAASA